MQPAQFAPARIRTDQTNPFARHTMSVRVPAIFAEVLERNPDYDPRIVAAVRALAEELRTDATLPRLADSAPFAESWNSALAARAHETWLATDWFFAETYAYRQLIERTQYWETRRDPFRAHKEEEYESKAFAQAFAAALADSSSPRQRLRTILLGSLFGNRIDLSFAASRERGMSAEQGDLLADDRETAIALLMDGTGPVHVVLDNAGTELMLDLVLADAVLETLGANVILHVKVHPTFVSDATVGDVRELLASRRHDAVPLASAFKARLSAALTDGRLTISEHAFWNGPRTLWDLPQDLEAGLRVARLVVLKGDANYRRALNDAIWPADTAFSKATAYFPAPLLALRTLKSDPIVGVSPKSADELDRLDPTWRVNGKRAVISLGGSGI